jgi:two-component system, NarL family, sensor histidine kinase UhpB
VNGSTAYKVSLGQQLAVAAAYAACYEVARYFSFSHWILTGGLRLACLLLMPPRFWPALVIGELLPSIENGLLHAADFGPWWALSAAVPLVLLWIPVVGPLRRRWPLRAADGSLQTSTLLLATLGTAAVGALATALELQAALLTYPDKWPDLSAFTGFWAYLIGGYLGALTLTPTLLALHERATKQRVTWAGLWHSRLGRDLVGWALPVCGGLAWVALAADQELLRQVARMALLLPVIGLAFRHGWHGTAIGGFIASAALATTITALLDPAMIRCQAVLALGISGTLVISAWLPRRHAAASPAARASR